MLPKFNEKDKNMNVNPQKVALSEPEGPLRVAIVGCGGIAGIVISALEEGKFPNVDLVGILGRTAGHRDGINTPILSDLDEFLALKPDLIIEMAGPSAFTDLVVDLISAADVWTISGKVLGSESLYQQIGAAGAASGHSLRLLPGAITGLDAVALAAADGEASIKIRYSNSEQKTDEAPTYATTAREIVNTCPGVNVVAAVAVAGLGMDETMVEYYKPKSGTTPVFTITASSAHSQYTVHGGILPGEKIATEAVASSVFAALKQQNSVIWVG